MASTLWQDIRYGARMLVKNSGVTIIVIIALALGIGANTAIFSVVNAVLLRPLPYQESERLVFLNEKSPILDEMSISYPNFLDWRAQNQTFEKIGVYNRASYNLTGTGEAERIVAGQVSADLFSVLRVNPLLGRVFTNDEDRAGGTPVVVLSYGLWQRRFGGQNSVLDQPITLNGKSYAAQAEIRQLTTRVHKGAVKRKTVQRHFVWERHTWDQRSPTFHLFLCTASVKSMLSRYADFLPECGRSASRDGSSRSTALRYVVQF